MLEIISGILKLIFFIARTWAETNAEKKKEQQETLKELDNAIKTGDTSTITSILSGL